jgi:hypothetical protein
MSSTTDRRMKAIYREIAASSPYTSTDFNEERFEGFINGGIHKDRARLIFSGLLSLLVVLVIYKVAKAKKVKL